jgi:hypothetical protein
MRNEECLGHPHINFEFPISLPPFSRDPRHPRPRTGRLNWNPEVAMRKRSILALTIMLWTVQAGAQFVAPGGTIPAVANISGDNGTFWKSDVSILNLSSAGTEVVLVLLPELKGSVPTFEPAISDPMPIPGNGQLTLANVVVGVFGLRNVKGGLSVFSNNGAPLVLASRTYTSDSVGGSYGVNVNGVLVADTAWVANVEHDGFFRTNVGVFLPIDPPVGQSLTFTVTVFDAAGVEVAQGRLVFSRAGLRQTDLEFFGLEDVLLDGWVSIRCDDPTTIWYAYATVIDNVSGDSVFRPAIGQQSSIP